MLQIEISNILSQNKSGDVLRLLEETGASLLQYPLWTEITQPSRKKWYATALDPKGTVCCFALISAKFWHGAIWFGPVSSSPEYLPEFLTRSAACLKKKGIGLLSVVNNFTDDSRDVIIHSLKKNFRLSSLNSISPWATIVVDLMRSEEKLFSDFTTHHKRAIKRAVSSGIVISPIEHKEDVASFADLYKEMYRKRNLLMPVSDPEGMFHDLFQFIEQTDKGKMWGVFSKGKLLGGAVIGYHGRDAFYHFGASDHNFRDQPIMHLLFFEVMKRMKQRGFARFDLGGYAITNPGDQLENINRFKKGFGGVFVQYSMPINIILSGYKFLLIRVIKPLVAKFRR